MGYRSEIYICCEADCEELIEAIKEAKPDFQELDDGKFTASFNGWKWYESYDHVNKITLAIDKIEPREFVSEYNGRKYQDLPFGFIRIGEDYADIEEYGRPYDYGIRVVRYLEWG
jgi:hypothetical protein